MHLEAVEIPPPDQLGPEPESLAEFTASQHRRPVIKWYRSPLTREQLRTVTERSDALAFAQTLAWLAIFALTAAAAIYSAAAWPWYATLGLIFLHGMVASFLINGVHELGHGTVFKSKWLNELFVHIYAFLGWINHEKFEDSHTRHHRYTLHPPDDLEVTLPMRVVARNLVETGFIRPQAPYWTIRDHWRVARARFKGPWEMTLYPENAPEKRVAPVRWARVILGGHALILLACLGLAAWTREPGWLVAALLFGVPIFYGNWLQSLCNNTQHIGLVDNVPDFRLCCRTFTLNPFVQFLYWHMNYHTEHHMYPAVPCYHLGKLHRMIRADLPPTPHGLAATWREIAAIQKLQEADPGYQHLPFGPSEAAR